MDNQYQYGQQPAQNPYPQQPQQPGFQQQPAYPQQPQVGYQPSYVSPYTEEPVSIGEWIVMFLLSSIPLVGLIMFIVWLASSSTKKSKKNYLIAGLIWGIIISVITGIIIGILAAAGVALPSILENL